MKLVRYGRPGSEKPGLIDADGVLRDLSTVVPDLGPEQLAPKVMARLAKLKPAKLARVRGRPRLGPPVKGTRNFVGIGLNYRDHAAEQGLPIPSEPIMFMKSATCIVGPNDDVMLPRGSTKGDWEAELGIVIGTRTRHVSRKDALAQVAGYLVVNDVSERSFQFERGGQWDKGKMSDTFGPIGPWLVTTDELPNPQRLDVWLDLNGEPMQRGSTRSMIFGCAELVSYVSRFMTLWPGDIITTGTPPGVGMGKKPPHYLKAGDVMTLGISGLGQQTRRVGAFRR
ncbi:MAG: fumarylacetoacetate hydrolase family protein [Burkholderiales bacterium]|nr:MAG: fumarylacetoacetate hydrolase family protein [Burkholderiales bacterium]